MTITAAHKAALAEGRTLSATVDRYLRAVNTPGKRGRKVTKETLEGRLAAAREAAKSATGVEMLLAKQQIRDCTSRLATMRAASNGRGVKGLEGEFVKIARRFSLARGISYGAWRDAGVPAAVLKRAGIARTRG